ncbi:MAG: DUF1592 domain-containing protein [Lentisphaerales bacterium]|nr:DUF1592 domain-containing protein [Lentisphaerales bacterium]
MKKILATLLILASPGLAKEKSVTLTPNIKTFLEDHCVKCHNAKKTKGGTRLDNVEFTIRNEAEAQYWKDILDIMNVGEMPPEDEPQPSLKENETFIGNLTESLEEARKVLVDSGGEIAIRHMNNREYKNVIQDLLGVDINTTELPLDTGEGFDTLAKNQHFTSVRFETYNQIAEIALVKMFEDEQIRIKSKPKKTRLEPEKKKKRGKTFESELKAAEANLAKLISAKDNPKLKKELGMASGDQHKKAVNNARHAVNKLREVLKSKYMPYYQKGAVLGDSDHLTRRFPNAKFKISKIGTYKYRMRVFTISDQPDKHAYIRMNRGHRNDPEKDLVYHKQISGSIKSPQILEFTMVGGEEKAPYFNINYFNSNPNTKAIKPLFVDWVEQEGPFYEPNTSPGFKLLSQQNLDKMPHENVASLIREFAELAFRTKSPSEELLNALNKHFEFLNTNSGDQRSSIIKTLAAIMSTPHFLYISEYNSADERIEISDQELANRLSFFLWSSIPDEELKNKAAAGELKNKDVLAKEIDRMLASPKAENFYKAFSGQWLGTDRIESVEELKRYPFFGNAKHSMINEPAELFKYLTDKNYSALNMVDSNFVVVDSLLADYYGLPFPAKNDGSFQRVNLPKNSVRGGLMSQGAVLTITSRPDRTSPIDRGAYILRKILNSPPSEPPANVPDADFEAKNKTMREILELHQSKAQCSSCHRKIDPLGFAMENFDQFGALKPEKMMRKVDTTGTMPDGQRKFSNFKEMKKLMLEDREQFITGFTESLMSYALGRGISFTDEARIKEIIATNKSSNFKTKDLIKEIVFSEQFMRK